jgi:pimeloyl-ACP methyl ester carboxylesterase
VLVRDVAGRYTPSLGELESLRAGVLLMAGDGDEFSPLEELRNLGGWIPRAEVVAVPGTDHFFGRREREVADLVGSWVDSALQTS